MVQAPSVQHGRTEVRLSRAHQERGMESSGFTCQLQSCNSSDRVHAGAPCALVEDAGPALPACGCCSLRLLVSIQDCAAGPVFELGSATKHLGLHACQVSAVRPSWSHAAPLCG